MSDLTPAGVATVDMRRLVKVAVTPEFLAQFFSAFPEGMYARCDSGLPQGAKLVRIVASADGADFIFAHESFAVVLGEVPAIPVTFGFVNLQAEA